MAYPADRQDIILWEAVAENLDNLIGSKAYYRDPTARYKDAAAICNVGGVDIAALDKAAEERFPVPKSWAGLNEDGTAKSEKKAKTDGKKARAPKEATTK
jgi:hypothetical protein